MKWAQQVGELFVNVALHEAHVVVHEPASHTTIVEWVADGREVRVRRDEHIHRPMRLALVRPYAVGSTKDDVEHLGFDTVGKLRLEVEPNRDLLYGVRCARKAVWGWCVVVRNQGRGERRHGPGRRRPGPPV